MNTPTPRTDEWETYCDECYYHMWRVRRKNERGFNDGFHVQNGEGARQLVELLNKQDEALFTVTEQRDGLRSGIDYASDQLTKVTGERDRLDDQLDHILLRLGKTQERMIDAERQLDRLEAEIRLTIMENVHLADGDVCTLKRLKDAIGFEFNESLQPLKPTEP